MRVSTFTLATFLSFAASTWAAPVIAPGEATLLAVEPTLFEFEAADVEVTEVEESTLAKRAQCTDFFLDLPACNNNYYKSGSSCVKNSSKSSSSSSKSSAVVLSSSTYSGQGTWYTQNGVRGACGSVNSDSSHIIALHTKMYANGAHCGKTVKIRASNGKSITAKVADECPSCVSTGSLDLSVGAFKSLASLDAGVVSLSWSFS
ncbi:hypothetical protein JCM11641_002941 [Rhodosporidiobolus odoratus]